MKNFIELSKDLANVSEEEALKILKENFMIKGNGVILRAVASKSGDNLFLKTFVSDESGNITKDLVAYTKMQLDIPCPEIYSVANSIIENRHVGVVYHEFQDRFVKKN